ncbi:MAG: hypothetical protein HGA25_01770 [Clostridiales bacterium]|nr:hypothetical protein [Clostridiales bacterium]
MDANILVLLEQQLDNFSAISGFLNEKGLNSTTLFLPQSLKGIAEEIKHRNDLLIECFTYLDLVKIYSLTTYNDSELFTNNIIDVIGSNRTAPNERLMSNKEAVDDFLFTSKDDLGNFLLNNNFLISLYIFSMIKTMFYKQT